MPIKSAEIPQVENVGEFDALAIFEAFINSEFYAIELEFISRKTRKTSKPYTNAIISLRTKLPGTRSKMKLADYNIAKLTAKEKTQVKGRKLPKSVCAKLVDGGLSNELITRIDQRPGRGRRPAQGSDNDVRGGDQRRKRSPAKTRANIGDRAGRRQHLVMPPDISDDVSISTTIH